MPSEKAKENKTLVAQCAACTKSVSTELIHSFIVRRSGKRTAIPVCDECRQKGWELPSEAKA